MTSKRVARCGFVGACVLLACIIPDRDIQFSGGPENPGAVKILHRPPMLEEMRLICDEPDERLRDLRFCPDARAARLPGLLRNELGPFCVCATGGDRRALPAFNVYAEDPDITPRGQPTDTLYGVLRLDPSPQTRAPSRDFAYPNFLEPGSEGTFLGVGPVQRTPPRTAPSRARPPAGHWLFRLDDGTGRGFLDLCNDNNGRRLAPGLHDLQVMITDRPFFAPVVANPDGTPIEVDGEPLRGPQQWGVPDLAQGATYAVANYAFECLDELQNPGACDCEDDNG